jgi:glycosyltransferase involved in cell wall biosynthesis
VLRHCLSFSDQVLVLDDGSTDGSPELAHELGCQVLRRDGASMWGQEAPARAELWHWGAEAAGDGWLLICDADQILYGDIRPLLRTTQHNAWAWSLFDCWNDERYYRADGFWQGYKLARPWLFKPSTLTEPALWPDRALHTGHCPANFPMRCGTAPYDIYWSHLGWLNPADRQAKYQRYMTQADHLTPFERAHVASILD